MKYEINYIDIFDPGSRISGFRSYQDTGIQEYQATGLTRIQGYRNIRVQVLQGYRDTGISGFRSYQDKGIQEYQATGLTRIQGYKYIRLQGYTRIGIFRKRITDTGYKDKETQKHTEEKKAKKTSKLEDMSE